MISDKEAFHENLRREKDKTEEMEAEVEELEKSIHGKNIRIHYECEGAIEKYVHQFYWKRTRKRLSKILNTLRCDMVMSFLHYNDVMDRRTARVWLFVFYLSYGLVRVCE